MSHPLPFCQCPSGNAPCGHDITQEDMLCDDCRAGYCRRARAFRDEMLDQLKMSKAQVYADVRIEWENLWPRPVEGE